MATTDPERNCDESPAHPRTAGAEAGLADASAHRDADAVDGVLDCALSATEAACLAGPHLLDWDEQREVAL